jgi:hypothetical protein
VENPELGEIEQLLRADTPGEVIAKVIEAFTYSHQTRLLVATLRLAAEYRDSEARVQPRPPEPVLTFRCKGCQDIGILGVAGQLEFCSCNAGKNLQEKQRYEKAHEALEHLMAGYTGGGTS